MPSPAKLLIMLVIPNTAAACKARTALCALSIWAWLVYSSPGCLLCIEPTFGFSLKQQKVTRPCCSACAKRPNAASSQLPWLLALHLVALWPLAEPTGCRVHAVPHAQSSTRCSASQSGGSRCGPGNRCSMRERSKGQIITSTIMAR